MTDRLIRITTALAVVAVAVVAAIISYQHAYELVRSHGECQAHPRPSRIRAASNSGGGSSYGLPPPFLQHDLRFSRVNRLVIDGEFSVGGVLNDPT